MKDKPTLNIAYSNNHKIPHINSRLINTIRFLNTIILYYYIVLNNDTIEEASQKKTIGATKIHELVSIEVRLLKNWM